MEAIWQWGITFIRDVQQVRGPVLDGFFRGVTFLGNEEFFLIFLPFIYWSVDDRFGWRFGFLFFISGFVNYGLKEIFTHPRPFELAPGINVIEEEGYGLPSGHAQLAVTVWGALAARLKRPRYWAAAAAVILLVGFSRIYLGVHFPTDVFAGWLVGGAVLAGYLLIVSRVREEARAPRSLLPWLLTLIPIGAALAMPHAKGAQAVLAAFWGFWIGRLAFERLGIDLSSGSVLQRAVRFAVGAVVLAGLYVGLSALFPKEGEALYLAARGLRYAALGLWTSLGAPLCFRALRLTGIDAAPSI